VLCSVVIPQPLSSIWDAFTDKNISMEVHTGLNHVGLTSTRMARGVMLRASGAAAVPSVDHQPNKGALTFAFWS